MLTNPHRSMDSFLTDWAASLHSDQTKKNILKSVLATSIGLGLTALLGVGFFQIHRNKHTKQDLKAIAERSLYYMFILEAEDTDKMRAFKLDARAYITGLLDRMDDLKKMQVLELALTEPKKYRENVITALDQLIAA